MNEIALRDGTTMPSIGLGYWKIPADQTAALTVAAIDAGYRHLDGAADYGNEQQAGHGLATAISSGAIERNDVWITSKLWNTYHHPKHVAAACERCLQDWQLDYFDSFLIHFPIAQQYVDFDVRYPPAWIHDPGVAKPQVELATVPIIDTWLAMTKLVDRGLVRHIGVCNFGVSLLRDLINSSNHPPDILQVEMHPRLQQEKLLRFCNQQSIAVTAFSPLGAPSYVPLGMATASDNLLLDPAIIEIASAHDRTPAQVLLRWGLQRGTAVIPKTQTQSRLMENIKASEFTLSDDQMETIHAMDRGQRYNDPGEFAEAAFGTFLPIYE